MYRFVQVTHLLIGNSVDINSKPILNQIIPRNFNIVNVPLYTENQVAKPQAPKAQKTKGKNPHVQTAQTPKKVKAIGK
jgi:hypothetical protein